MTNHAPTLAPVERDEDMDRTYIPLPGGWEVQTKGKGSTFRLADIKRDDRYAVFDTTIHKVLVQMAHDIRADYDAALVAERERCAKVVEDWAKMSFPAGEEEAASIAAAIRSRDPVLTGTTNSAHMQKQVS